MSKQARLREIYKAAKSIPEENRYSCHAMHYVVGMDEFRKYSEAMNFLGLLRFADGFHGEEWLYSEEQKELTRQLAILMYREMVKAGEVP